MWGISVFLLLLIGGSLGDTVVQLQNGKVRGTTINTPSGKTFYAWKGIPFAQPPVGKLRYLAPLPAEPWEGILNATRDSPACILFERYSTDPGPTNGQSEDCLYLNIYSPLAINSNNNVSTPLSVMFWIYGGGFYSGFSDFDFYDPTPLLDENVIVVTSNYRLGTLGFLSTEDDVILGNAGLKDQLLALQWTRENIASFGGDPKSITIFGESAGGVSVGFHILSPKSRGLFKSAIMESGSALTDLMQKNARDIAFTLASQIDSSVSSSEQVRDVMQNADVDLLVKLTAASQKRLGPVVEIESSSSFITKPFYEQLKSGNFTKVPIIIGHNSAETLCFSPDVSSLLNQAKYYDEYPINLAPNMPLKPNVSTEEVGKAIHAEYAGENGLLSENLAACVEWNSDNSFVRSIHKQAIIQSKLTPVYLYQFSYYGTLSKDNIIIPGAGRVGHAQEVGYLFNNSIHPLETEEDFLTRKRFVKLWTNFAKTSNPTPDDDSKELLQNVRWVPVTENNLQHLDIDEDLKMKPNRKAEKDVFWENLWNTYSYHPYCTY